MKKPATSPVAPPARDAVDEELWQRYLASLEDYTGTTKGLGGIGTAPPQIYACTLRARYESAGDWDVPAPAYKPSNGWDPAVGVSPAQAAAIRAAVQQHLDPAHYGGAHCPACLTAGHITPLVPGRLACAAHTPPVGMFRNQPPETAEDAKLCYLQAREADQLAPSPATRAALATAQNWYAPFVLGGGAFASRP